MFKIPQANQSLIPLLLSRTCICTFYVPPGDTALRYLKPTTYNFTAFRKLKTYHVQRMTHIKHEIILCERCSKPVVCKANSYFQCQCSQVQLSLNELQFVSESFEKCLCADCLNELKLEYQMFLKG
ncbi:cysteine-rich CWC family protein [Daejeonella sp.]|uniref:cysteine-rich CWC family protein n=1 Tax=Daejeonella sp. TaxID=2805397 RepID=UPI0030C345D2